MPSEHTGGGQGHKDHCGSDLRLGACLHGLLEWFALWSFSLGGTGLVEVLGRTIPRSKDTSSSINMLHILTKTQIGKQFDKCVSHLAKQDTYRV